MLSLVLILFQVANASAIPLTAARLGQQDLERSSLILAGLVLVPQVLAAFLATPVAGLADSLGRKPLLLVAFAVLGLLTPLVVADVTAGSGRYNLAQGAVGIATGLGAAVSTVVVGYAAQWFGYTAGLYMLAAAAAVGFAVVLPMVRETRHVPAAMMEPATS